MGFGSAGGAAALHFFNRPPGRLPMTRRRLERLNAQLHREINKMLRHELRDPRLQEVAASYVRVTSDLWLARVYMRLPQDEVRKAEAMEGLESAGAFIRKKLGDMLHIRRVPELRFLEDESIERARRIEQILEEELPGEDTEGEPFRAEGSRTGEESAAGDAPADPEVDEG